MALKLEDLLTKFRNINNFEYEGRKFITNVKSIAPKAYLFTIFKAADDEIQKNVIEPLKLPKSIREFYREYNGASLFVGAIAIYGFLPRHYLIDRSDWRKRLPYDLVEANLEHFTNFEARDIVIVGSYGHDRSIVYVEKTTGKVYCCVEDKHNQIRASWPSFDDWITQEIQRLSEYFDENGNRLVNLELTLPDAFKKFDA